MSLAEGDHNDVLDAVVSAIEADTGTGGLFESPDPPVKLVEIELRNEPRAYRDHEAPAIAVTLIGKDERREGGAAIRTYRLAIYVYCRGADSGVESTRCRKIVSRLEQVIRDENDSSRQFQGLPQSSSWALGALNVAPVRAEFFTGEEARRGQTVYAVLGLVEAEIEIPTVRY